ncbi:Stk1 family PASTA domain-containing Ser/Thr kinase [Bacillus sp. OV322]|uniref:Stk1 family PASTA domain-containing Ser/Thr kinase n=1 Tax=Bacillus sp. OV322 TaxID=1882764 RepID=UPI000B89F69D|nr:Stk1 family PASTA domain-containing Ser/Thr kinase [Bacillus sp. OV322]
MLIGKRINGRYKLLDMVGGGGMANVYLARDMILEREVALKILRMDFNNDEEFIKRFNREAQSATSLAHPNIVSIYDVGEEDDIYYIVMEYVNGLTLKQYIQKHYPVPIRKALDIMKQITAAISHAHHNGIIHRDIKPQNILIDEQGTVKITDFGIAMALSSTNITQTNAVLGSVHYLSPEQARGGMANKKSDIYSLGIVMFELLTGRLPFSGESAVSIALKHLQSETPSPKRWNPAIPQSVENIILKATAKDSYYRYESVDALEEDIRTALDPERQNEKPFIIPMDDDATKAIPIITQDSISNYDETIVRGHEKSADPVDKQAGAEEPEPVVKPDGKKLNNKKKKKTKTKTKKRRKRLPIILVTTFVVLALLGVMALTVFPNLFAAKEIKIPSVKNENLDDAMTLLLDKGLAIGETIKLEDEDVPDGKVIKTDPAEGQVVKEGTEVNIYQSIGREKTDVADYRDMDIDDVRSSLKKLGIKNINITEEYDDSDAGTILSQYPGAGLKIVPSDTVFDFTVSKGPEKVTLRDLTKYSKASLDDYEAETGITIDSDKAEYNDAISEGLVISQSPSAGTEIKKGSTVSVILSKGAKEPPPKTVSKEVSIDYEPDTEGKSQLVKIYISDLTRTMKEPADSFTITSPDKRKIELTIPFNDKAEIKVMRDDQVIMDEQVPYPED